MPQLTVFHVALFATTAFIGVAVGWLIRSKRCLLEKIAVNAGWHEQIEAQKREQDRLIDQNKHLMAQLNEAKTSEKDASTRVAQLSSSLEDSARKRDELKLELQEVRDNLESHLVALSGNEDTMNSALIDKDNKIFKLSRELNNWQQRLPPLIERFRVRNAEAERLEDDLAKAQARIAELEATRGKVKAPALPEEAQLSFSVVDMPAENHEQFHAAHPQDSPEAGGAADSLQMIKGIGPAIEKTLNDLGIFSVAQIAELSEYDIDRVASRLKGFRTRVYREDWIGQARELQYEATGSRS